MKAFMKKESVQTAVAFTAMFIFVYCAGYFGLR